MFLGETLFFAETSILLLMIMLAMLMFNAGLGLKISYLKTILRIKHIVCRTGGERGHSVVYVLV